MAESPEFMTLGFIGLGAMGKPMLEHLAKKLHEESRIWVYDVIEQLVDEVCTAFPNRVFKGVSARDVAEHTVGCFLPPMLYRSADRIGHHLDHGPRRLSRADGIPRS